MNQFKSYYWTPENLESETLQKAFYQLFSEDSTNEKKVLSFKTLLESDSVVAQSMAFDQFFYTESLTRFGNNNPYEQFSEQLLSKARQQLKNPPITANKLNEETVGANYASAFGVLAHLGQEEDIFLIEPIIRSSQDIGVLWSGLFAAEHCLSSANNLYLDFTEILSKIILDEEQNLGIRTAAIGVIGAISEYAISSVEELLVRGVNQCSLPISAHAAWLLGFADLPKYATLLQEISNTWGDDAIYPASEVRDLLKEIS
ncbi:hypothetical protein NIES4074_37140 [Cylindrospermum sp. NIES-4074]|nr:hypothetical protein NIES4074_37140 [Cylindrospermum sp. NIES-4074]